MSDFYFERCIQMRLFKLWNPKMICLVGDHVFYNYRFYTCIVANADRRFNFDKYTKIQEPEDYSIVKYEQRNYDIFPDSLSLYER